MAPGQQTSTDFPAVSVVVPVRNGARDLAACLDAIAAAVPAPAEVIVVDDASTDGTAEVALGRGATVLRLDSNHGPAYARNRGAEAARGEIVFFTDADVRVRPDAIGIAADALRRGGSVAAILGSYDESPADPGFVSQYKNLFHHWVHQHSREEASTFWTGCGAIRRETFLAVGGFNEGYRRPSIEDIELGARLRAAGCRIRLEKRMQATHAKRWRLWNLLRTDVQLRGAPWIALMLRDRHWPKELNLSTASKAATVVSVLFAAAMLAVPVFGAPAAVLPAVAALAASAFVGRRAASAPPGSGALAVALVTFAPLLVGAMLPSTSWPLAAVPLALLVALVLSHVDLYAFFARRRGTAFAVGVLPMHLLFQLCCALSVPLGVLEHLRDVRRARRAAEGPAIRELEPLALHSERPRARRQGA